MYGGWGHGEWRWGCLENADTGADHVKLPYLSFQTSPIHTFAFSTFAESHWIPSVLMLSFGCFGPQLWHEKLYSILLTFFTSLNSLSPPMSYSIRV